MLEWRSHLSKWTLVRITSPAATLTSRVGALCYFGTRQRGRSISSETIAGGWLLTPTLRLISKEGRLPTRQSKGRKGLSSFKRKLRGLSLRRGRRDQDLWAGLVAGLVMGAMGNRHWRWPAQLYFTRYVFYAIGIFCSRFGSTAEGHCQFFNYYFYRLILFPFSFIFYLLECIIIDKYSADICELCQSTLPKWWKTWLVFFFSSWTCKEAICWGIGTVDRVGKDGE